MPYTIQALREHYNGEIVSNTIKGKLMEYALEDAETVESVIECLERIDCAACSSPAPIYYNEMAPQLATHWAEIDESMDSYKDATGEFWKPKDEDNFRITDYLWFAYEWIASELASGIRNEQESKAA